MLLSLYVTAMHLGVIHDSVSCAAPNPLPPPLLSRPPAG